MKNIINIQTKQHVVAGVEITTDEHGRFNLNLLHKASGLGKHKAPNKWLEGKQVKELIQELEHQTPNSGSALKVNNGGATPGTFAHELLAISYAGWISPAFQLQVNRVFLDYRTGNLQQPAIPQTLPEALRLAAELAEDNQRLESANNEMKPKAEFHDSVVASDGAISVAKAAKILNTGRNRLMDFLREAGWLTRNNEPYQSKIEAGLLDVKLGTYNHPRRGLMASITVLITGKGLTKLQKLYPRVA